MKGTSVKLSVLVVILLAFASFLSPFTAEARRKHVHHRNCHHRVRPSPVSPPPAPTEAPASAPNEGIPPYQIHGCGYPCSDSNDCDWPCTVCCANQTCCYDEPFVVSDPYPLPGPSPSVEEPVPAPAPAPTDGAEIPPYQIHGCGYPCSDSNDCDWPCTICSVNQTCSYDEPIVVSDPFPLPGPSPSVEEPVPAPASAPTDVVAEIAPYNIHDCGYACRDSNDCDWPCTVCSVNQTCSYDESVVISDPFPLPGPSPSVEESVAAPASAPAPDVAEIAPSNIPNCGHGCRDSNDCDWPCTVCSVNNTCEEPAPAPEAVFVPPFPSSDPITIAPLSPSQPPALPPSTGDETDDDDVLAPPPTNYDIGVPADVPPQGYEFTPYQVHGCGYGPCNDSNDCDWPCTTCCANQTCCHEEDMF
ncbi:uncharacterized protein [Spinacia oleracea]|uniref:Uncharacterized protein n=1 Tax=Spinacia oleracea TaxID=3562 RepID=A0A9R0K695_SPIOL|nr:uncharacterized protein LOC110798172 [Spinacia oleracea]